MRNERTPRTLAEASFVTGYPAVEHAHHRSTDWRSVALAVVIGVGMALAYASWWGA